jgi:hypothetical protein
MRSLDGDGPTSKSSAHALKINPANSSGGSPRCSKASPELPKGHEDAAKEIAALQSKIDDIIADAKAPLDQRLAVLPLLSSRKWAAVEPVMKNLLTSNQPTELTTATVALLKKFAATSTAPLIYELLPKAGPAPETRPREPSSPRTPPPRSNSSSAWRKASSPPPGSMSKNAGLTSAAKAKWPNSRKSSSARPAATAPPW